MISNCPFYPGKLNPCVMSSCQFRCVGGCAILLSAHAFDALREIREVNQKADGMSSRLSDLEFQVSRLKR